MQQYWNSAYFYISVFSTVWASLVSADTMELSSLLSLSVLLLVVVEATNWRSSSAPGSCQLVRTLTKLSSSCFSEKDCMERCGLQTGPQCQAGDIVLTTRHGGLVGGSRSSSSNIAFRKWLWKGFSMCSWVGRFLKCYSYSQFNQQASYWLWPPDPCTHSLCTVM